MTQETQGILDEMILAFNENKLKPYAFYMHPTTKEEKQIPNYYKGINIFVSWLMPINSIYLKEQDWL